MGRISQIKEDKIREDLLGYELDLHKIAKKHSVTVNAVRRVNELLKFNKPPTIGICGFAKRSSYFDEISEEEIGQMPSYSPDDLEGWELYEYWKGIPGGWDSLPKEKKIDIYTKLLRK